MLMKKITLFLLFAILMSVNAFASCFMRCVEVNVSTQQFAENNGQVEIPVEASIDARADAWWCQVVLPEGVTLIDATSGPGMTLPYLDQNGNQSTYGAVLEQVDTVVDNGAVFRARTIQNGYWSPNQNGVYEPYGTVKWEPGYYNEMFYLHVQLDESFAEGEIRFITRFTSTVDERGGTLLENDENGEVSEMSSWISREFYWMPQPVMTFYYDDEVYNFIIEGEGNLSAQFFYNDLNGNEELMADLSGEGEITYCLYRADEDYVVRIEVTASAPYCISNYKTWEVLVMAREPIEPTPQSLAPSFSSQVIESEQHGSGYRVTIHSYEPEGVVYYRVGLKNSDNDWDFGTYYEYSEPLDFFQDGTYRIEAYCVAPGCLPSVDCAFEFVWRTPEKYYDFVEDGIFYKIIGTGKVSVSYETIEYNTYSGNVVIPNQVTHDGVTYKVTAIRDNAFRDCSDLTAVTIGGYVTTIGNRAFMNCDGLIEVVLGNYVITVGDEAFASCSSLTSLTIGSGVATIGNDAFAGCTALTTVNCKPATPPVMKNRNCFACYGTATLHVYPAVEESYRATAWWNEFATIVGEDNVDPAPGDVNGDGLLNVSDISTLLNNLLNAD